MSIRLENIEKRITALEITVNQLSKDFAQIRLDLKSAHILHDEEYVPPPIDDLSKQTRRPTQKSKVEKMVEDSDPFD